MKVKCENNLLKFEPKTDDEKIFLVYATSLGDGDSFARFMTDKEIEEEGWFDASEWASDYDASEWTADYNDIEIGERITYVGFGGGHNFIARVN